MGCDRRFSLASLLRLFLIVLVSASCVHVSAKDSSLVSVDSDHVFVQDTLDNEVKVMFYNVLNLFDAEKDGDHNDWTFLPLQYPGKLKACDTVVSQRDRQMCHDLDWTQARVNLKIKQIAKAVRFQGSIPDVLALAEIENDNVVSMIAKELGYDGYIVTDSRTERGIDVALLYKSTKLNKIGNASLVAAPRGGETRDILRVDFSVTSGKKSDNVLSVYVNHWPSQASPTQARLYAAGVLATDIDNQVKKYGSQRFHGVALGDFNVIEKDSPNPFDDFLYKKDRANALVDGHSLAMGLKNHPARQYMPEGTYYYAPERRWNLLDKVAMTKNLVDGSEVEYIPASYRIVFPSLMSWELKPKQGYGKGKAPGKSVRAPNRYNFFAEDESGAGFSDHLPVVFKLAL